MHRIDTSTAQKDKFGAGKNGFTTGDPQSGTPATEVSADILDAFQEEICAVIDEADINLEKNNNKQLLMAIKKLVSTRYFTAGQTLPTTNIGPIWHDDYNDWMVWREFTANGAAYSGYASRLIGSLLLDTQPTPRAGYIKSGVQNLSRTTYAALRAWALHNGIMVAPGVWTAGAIQCADNADGTTFRIYDVRGEFMRAWDDGRGVDLGRAILSAQQDDFMAHTHTPQGVCVSSANNAGNYAHGVSSTYAAYNTRIASQTTSSGGTETRPRNTALLAAIKF